MIMSELKSYLKYQDNTWNCQYLNQKIIVPPIVSANSITFIFMIKTMFHKVRPNKQNVKPRSWK